MKFVSMVYQTLENNITDIDLQKLLNFPSLDYPLFYPLLLSAFFIIFASASYFREVQRQGSGDFLSSLAVSGFVTIAIAVILSLLELISTTVLVITIVAALVFQVFFLLSGRD